MKMLLEFIAATRQNVTAWCIFCTLINAVYIKHIIITRADIAIQVFHNNFLIKEILTLLIIRAPYVGNFLNNKFVYDGSCERCI